MAKNGLRTVATAMIMGGIGATIGYIKCLGDITEDYADKVPDGVIEARPTKNTRLRVYKSKKEKES